MELSPTAQMILSRKYKTTANESWNDLCLRVAEHVASAEENQSDYFKKYFQLINNLILIPGGRILANAGTAISNLSNCYVLDVEDSRDGIYSALGEAAEIFSQGGGVGYTFSKLREKDSSLSTGGSASGPVSFMELFNDTGELIQQNSRRAAQMGILDARHPDIFEFIECKSELSEKNQRILDELKHYKSDSDEDFEGTLERVLLSNQLTYFNISVMLTDSFMEAVRDDLDWHLISPKSGRVVDTTRARLLLRAIATRAWKSGDPGVAFYDRINKDNLTPYLGDITASNPCLHKDSILLDGDNLSKISQELYTHKSWKTGVKNTIKLTTNAGHEIVVTPEHQIMLEDGSFIEAEDSLDKSIAWGLGSRSSDSVLESDVLLGFLFGDGSISGRGLGVQVKINKEREMEVASLLQTFGLIQQEGGAFYKNKKSLESDLGRGLGFLDFRVFDRNVPEEILYSNSQTSKGFLRGLFEANGSVTKSSSQISLKSTNRQLVSDIQIMLASFGVPSWIVVNPAKEIKWKNGTYLSRTSYNLQIAPRNSKIFLERIGFVSDYKNNRIKLLDGKYRTKLKVTSIEPNGNAEVWDFSTQVGYEMSNGIIVHNCGEIFMLPGESCCLSALNLTKFFDSRVGGIDFTFLEHVVRTAVRFLDGVIEMSHTGIDLIDERTKGLRRLGLGVMGFADLLALLDIPYDSEDAVSMGEYLSWFISFFALLESNKIAEEKGEFSMLDRDSADFSYVNRILNESFSTESKFDIDNFKLRNVSVTTIAPTGSTALLADVNSGIEPFFLLAYNRHITDGQGNLAKATIQQVNQILMSKLEDLGLSNKQLEHVKGEIMGKGSIQHIDFLPQLLRDTFKTSHEIHWKDHIAVQAAWQGHVTNSISKTISMSEDSTVDDIEQAIVTMWESGLKGGTIYRENSKIFQILNKM